MSPLTRYISTRAAKHTKLCWTRRFNYPATYIIFSTVAYLFGSSEEVRVKMLYNYTSSVQHFNVHVTLLIKQMVTF